MAKVACTCQQCGAVFRLYRTEIEKGRGKYCSKECYSSARPPRVRCTCLQCGGEFYVYPSHITNGGGKYCGTECYRLSKKGKTVRIGGGEKVDRICEACHKTFKAFPSRVAYGGARFCSRKCSGIVHAGENNTTWRGGGHRGYRGPNWLRQRKLVYQRDGDNCQYCNRKRRAEEPKFPIHHIKPYYLFNGDYLTANQTENLLTLCPKCHKQAEWGSITLQPKLI